MKKVLTLVMMIAVCIMLSGCGLFTSKSEVTHCEVESTAHPVCEIEMNSNN